jgi:hypothetical protein
MSTMYGFDGDQFAASFNAFSALPATQSEVVVEHVAPQITEYSAPGCFPTQRTFAEVQSGAPPAETRML